MAAAATLPAGFEEIDLVTGLSRPVKVAWTPDGRRLIAEKDGVLKVAAPGASSATTVLDFRSQVNHAADRGFLGLAVDVNYAQNNYVYLLYTHELQPMIPDQESAAADAKLDRIKLSPTNAVSDRTTILGTESAPNACPPPNNTIDCIPSDDTSHSIGTVISAPDGTLFVGAGDGAKFSGVDERALRSLDERSLAGKVLHIDRNGFGLTGHAFCPGVTDLTQNCTKIHAKGFRNPFRFTRRASDGAITLGDVGWGSWEEINLIPTAGRDYGWPCYEGQFPNTPYSGFGPCQAYANGTTPAPSPPAIAFQHEPGLDNAVLAGPTYTGGLYPATYQNKLFTGDYGRGLMRVVTFNAQGVGSATQFATNWLGVDLASAPGSGNIVYVYPGATFSDGEGEIREIRYSPGNRQPVARASANPTFGPAPLTVSFNGAASSDPDGDPLSYSWSFGDGGTSTQPNPSHTYPSGGAYNATLTVSDGKGGSHTSPPIRIDVDNAPPVPSIQAPATYRGGQSVVVRGSATDPEDGPVPGSRLVWRVLLVHGTHNHPRSVPNGNQISFVADPQHDADSHYELTLTATDSDGRAAATSARIDPQTAPVHLRSEPSGAPVSYGDLTYTTPKDLISAVGFEPTVVVPPELRLSGGVFGFQGWSDGGGRLHTISVPPGGLTLTARYGLLVPAPPDGPGPGGNPPGGPAADTRAPKLTLSATRVRDLRRGIVRGQASDPGGTVKTVLVGLARRAGSKCRWWSARLDRPAARARGCRNPAWMKASLKRVGTSSYSWRLALGARVAPGRYLLRVRAQDAAGNATTGPVSSRGVRLRVKR